MAVMQLRIQGSVLELVQIRAGSTVPVLQGLKEDSMSKSGCIQLTVSVDCAGEPSLGSAMIALASVRAAGSEQQPCIIRP